MKLKSRFDKTVLKKILSITSLVILIASIVAINVEGKIQITSIVDKESLVDSPNTVPVIIGFKEKVGKDKEDLVRANGGKIKRVLKEVNAISARLPSQALNGLKNNPKVKYITENKALINISTETVPWGINKIEATLVHPQYKGTGVILAVTDTGIDYNHEDLVGRVIGGWDYVNNDPDPMDDYGHGTHVAGTIAANDNDIGIIGVAPEASLLNMKMCNQYGSCRFDDAAVSIIDSANSGAKIISMSWGCSGDPACDDPTERAAIQYAYSQGVLLIAAAGNNGGAIGYPAAYPEVMAITATDQNDNIASFSNNGPKAEVSAPGVDVLSTVPKGSCSLCDPSGYRLLSGTSMSTPHVSGTAALIWSAYPTLTASQVRKRITDYALDLGTPGRDQYYGYGRVDAFKSVTQNPPPPPPTPFYIMVQPDYNWIDGVTGGIQIQFDSQDDGISGAIPLGMNFNFYGTARNTLYVSTNGLIAFDNDGWQRAYSNSPIPNTNPPNNFIAAYWDDLYLDSPGNAYYKLDTSTNPAKLIITWQNIRLYSGSARTTFEVVLYGDGRILYQYQQPSSFENGGETIGVEDIGGVRGQQFKYNEPIKDYSAVLFIPAAGFTVTSPNGGENWQPGSAHTITWSYTGSSDQNVNIELLKGSGTNSIIASNVPNSGSYNWAIPSGQTSGTDYKVKIVSSTNSAIVDTSDNYFTISSPISITVVSPNGGEIWQSGSTKTVKWSYTGNLGSTVNIDLLKNGALVKTIGSGISIGSSGNGTFSWKMDTSRTPGTDYKIRVTSTSNSAFTDTSDNFFTITGPIIVTSPNGGENWRLGTSHTITWSKAGSSGSYVKIELLRSGTLFKTITSSTSNDGSYSWPISSTQTIASDYQIRITSTSNSAYKDTSDNFFTIST